MDSHTHQWNPSIEQSPVYIGDGRCVLIVKAYCSAVDRCDAEREALLVAHVRQHAPLTVSVALAENTWELYEVNSLDLYESQKVEITHQHELIPVPGLLSQREIFNNV